MGYDYDTFAADLSQLLEHLDLRDVVLCGFSMGTGEVVRYLGEYGSSRVSKAVLIGVIPPFVLKTDDNPEGVDREVFEGIKAGIATDRYAFFKGDTWLTDFRADLPKIDVPTLALHGTADRILPFAVTAARLSGLIDDVTVVPVEAGPHNIGWAHHEEVNRALLGFIAGTTAALKSAV
ncbi:MAG TPA: alpha/beta hydrolase [Solirubrobacteraceae bacterium]